MAIFGNTALFAFFGKGAVAGNQGALTGFSLALGMGVPHILLRLGVGHLLPKEGSWRKEEGKQWRQVRC